MKLATIFALVLSFGALAQAADKVPVKHGQIIQFDRALPLTENRAEKEQSLETVFEASDRRHRCVMEVKSPALSRPAVPAGLRVKVLWTKKTMTLVNPETGALAAKMYCIMDSANLGSLYMHPDATWSEVLEDKHLVDMLGAHVAEDVPTFNIGQ